jgi:hypothetical protein
VCASNRVGAAALLCIAPRIASNNIGQLLAAVTNAVAFQRLAKQESQIAVEKAVLEKRYQKEDLTTWQKETHAVLFVSSRFRHHRRLSSSQRFRAATSSVLLA